MFIKNKFYIIANLLILSLIMNPFQGLSLKYTTHSLNIFLSPSSKLSYLPNVEDIKKVKEVLNKIQKNLRYGYSSLFDIVKEKGKDWVFNCLNDENRQQFGYLIEAFANKLVQNDPALLSRFIHADLTENRHLIQQFLSYSSLDKQELFLSVLAKVQFEREEITTDQDIERSLEAMLNTNIKIEKIDNLLRNVSKIQNVLPQNNDLEILPIGKQLSETLSRVREMLLSEEKFLESQLLDEARKILSLLNEYDQQLRKYTGTAFTDGLDPIKNSLIRNINSSLLFLQRQLTAKKISEILPSPREKTASYLITNFVKGPVKAIYFDWGGTLDNLNPDERRHLFQLIKSFSDHIEIHILTAGSDVKQICEILEEEGTLEFIDSAIMVLEAGGMSTRGGESFYTDSNGKETTVKLRFDPGTKSGFLMGLTSKYHYLLVDNDARHFSYSRHVISIGVVGKGAKQLSGLIDVTPKESDGIGSLLLEDTMPPVDRKPRKKADYYLSHLADKKSVHKLFSLIQGEPLPLQLSDEFKKIPIDNGNPVLEIPLAVEKQIKQLLTDILGKRSGEQEGYIDILKHPLKKEQIAFLYQSFKTLMEQAYQRRSAIIREKAKRETSLTPKTIITTYADQIKGEELPLQVLTDFLKKYFKKIKEKITIHILPNMFQGPGKDGGFDISDFFKLNSEYVDWETITELSQDFGLMFDFVANHVSIDHAWFQEFLKGNPLYENFFIHWDADNPQQMEELKLIKEKYQKNLARPRIHDPFVEVTRIKDGKKVTCFVYMTFSNHQADLNYAEPNVLLKMAEVYLYYALRGANMLRFDAAPYLWKVWGTSSLHDEKTHKIIQLFRIISDLFSTKILLESHEPLKNNVAYLSSSDTKEAHMIYNFLPPALIAKTFLDGEVTTFVKNLHHFLNFEGLVNVAFASHDGSSINGSRDKEIFSEEELSQLARRYETLGHRYMRKKMGRKRYKEFCEEFKKRHDNDVHFVNYKQDGDKRLPYETGLPISALLNGNPTKIAAALTSALILKGEPILYLPALLATEPDWDAFLETGNPRELNRPKLNIQELEEKIKDRKSLTRQVFYKILPVLIEITTNKAFHPQGNMQYIPTNNNAVMSILRTSPDKKENRLILQNVSNQEQKVTLDLSEIEGYELISLYLTDIITKNDYAIDSEEKTLSLTLKPYQTLCLGADLDGKIRRTQALKKLMKAQKGYLVAELVKGPEEQQKQAEQQTVVGIINNEPLKTNFSGSDFIDQAVQLMTAHDSLEIDLSNNRKIVLAKGASLRKDIQLDQLKPGEILLINTNGDIAKIKLASVDINTIDENFSTVKTAALFYQAA